MLSRKPLMNNTVDARNEFLRDADAGNHLLETFFNMSS